MDLRYTISADDGPLRQALARTQAGLRETTSSFSSMASGLQGAFGRINVLMAGLTAALAGGAAINASVDATVTFTQEANKLARVLGINATEASALNVALGDIYMSADDFTDMAAKLAQQLKNNESGLQAMGLRTRDASGQLRPLRDLMLESIQVVNSYKQGIDRNIASTVIWGEKVKDAAAMLKLNSAAIDEAREKQEALGLVVGVEGVEDAKAYRAAMNDVGDVMLGIRKAVGDAVMPVLTELGAWFSSIGPAAVTVIRGAVGGLISIFWALRAGVVIVWETIDAMVVSVAEPIRAIGAAFMRMVTGDMQGAANEISNMGSVISDRWRNALINVGDAAATTRSRIGQLFTADTEITGGAPGGTGGRSAAGLVKPATPKTDKSDMGKWEAELNALKQSHAAQNAANGTFHAFSLEREREFWESKRRLATKANDDAFAIEGKITAATTTLQKEAFEERVAQLRRASDLAEQDLGRRQGLAQQELQITAQRYGAESRQAEEARRRIQDIERQAREQRRALRELEISEIAASKNQTLELELQQQRMLYDAGASTREQLLASETAFEQRRFEIQQQALMERQKLVDPTLNPEEYARIKMQILEAERQHQMQMSELNSATLMQSSANVRGSIGTMQSGWASAIKGMLAGTQTLGQGIRNIFGTIVDAVIGMLANMAAAWLAQQLIMMVMGKASTASTIVQKAGEAGAGGVASMAAAPWPLNMSAPAFGAAMAAAAMAFAPSASAAGGYDIPAGINPVTQLHAEEMVLPRAIANPLRRMIGNGDADGAGQSGGAGGGPVNIEMTVVTPNADSFRRSARQIEREQAAAVARALGR